jgi:hypothetical protein
LSPEDDIDIFQFSVGDVLLKKLDHARLNIFGNDFAGRTNNSGQSPTVVADAGANIRDNPTTLDSKRCKHSLGIFFLDSLGTNQPGRPFNAHCRRGLALGYLRVRDGEEYENDDTDGSKSLHGPRKLEQQKL